MPNSATFKDFYQVPDLAFDISKLRSDLDEILKNSPDKNKDFFVVPKVVE